MGTRERLWDLLRRAQGIVRLERSLSELHGELDARLAAVESQVSATHDVLATDIRAILRAIVAEDAENRRRLWQAREREDYEVPFRDAEPLVSVLIPTFNRPELLAQRSLPSVLRQSYERLEVIVVGDHAGPDVEHAALSLGDERVRFHNLTQRLPLDPDPRRRWFAQSVMARNEAARHARGSWIAWFDDDDEMQADAIRLLLDAARQQRVEVAYGRLRVLTPDGSNDLGEFPPRTGAFGWQAAIWHRSLRMFERELVSAYFDTPSDGFVVEAMLRAGVRFAMVPDVVCTYHPSQLR